MRFEDALWLGVVATATTLVTVFGAYRLFSALPCPPVFP
jgi:hypothetical protein